MEWRNEQVKRTKIKRVRTLEWAGPKTHQTKPKNSNNTQKTETWKRTFVCDRISKRAEIFRCHFVFMNWLDCRRFRCVCVSKRCGRRFYVFESSHWYIWVEWTQPILHAEYLRTVRAHNVKWTRSVSLALCLRLRLSIVNTVVCLSKRSQKLIFRFLCPTF